MPLQVRTQDAAYGSLGPLTWASPRYARVDYLAKMNPVISQLEALITRLDRQRAHIELSLMDQTRPAQEQEQLKQTYDLLFELRQIAATSLAVVQRLERELAQLKEQENGSGG